MSKLDSILSGNGVSVLDGAMGTELASMGLEMGGQNCLSHPQAVFEVHRAYVAAGCDALTTNTLTMNRIYIESHGVEVDVRAVNLAGAKLARGAAGALPVLGDISSTGQMLEPYGELSIEACETTFKEQSESLAEGGVDGFILETFMDLNEAVCALRACRAIAPKLPVLATLSFQSVRATIMGNAPADSARVLVDAGAFAVGVNCTSLCWEELEQILEAISAAVTAPVIVQPNGGKPRLQSGRPVFEMTPADFSQGMMRCIGKGARIVGGCCGTTPAHIRALRSRLAGG